MQIYVLKALQNIQLEHSELLLSESEKNKEHIDYL